MPQNIDECQGQLAETILKLDESMAIELAQRILEIGGDADKAINEVIKPTADEIGLKFQNGEFFLPQLLLAGNALEAAMKVFQEACPEQAGKAKHTVVIGTVKGDVHTIGKNVVAMMLQTGGFKVYDLGTDVEAATFIEEAQKKKADIIALSSLLTTTLEYQRDVIEELKKQNLRKDFKVLIGGGPTTLEWARQIGADGHGKDAAEALKVARKLIGSGGN